MKSMRWLRKLMGQPTCAEVAEVLQSYLDEELDAEMARRVHDHLDECRRCGMEANTYEDLKTVLRRGPHPLSDEPVRRLREFGERLARGDLDSERLHGH